MNDKKINWLKKLRNLFKKTQKEVADESSVNKFSIENIEQLKRKGSSETVTSLLEYFYSLENVSFASDELIEELKQDIEEFGENKIFYAMFEIKESYFFLTNYDFIVEEEPLTEEEKSEYDFIVELKAKDILKLLEIQNETIKK